MKNFTYAVVILFGVYMQGCASTPIDPAEKQRQEEARHAAQQAELKRQAEIDRVVVTNGAPPGNAQQAGTVSATDGKGCGLLGIQGTYEGAIAALKEKAHSLGANYVNVLTVKEPVAHRHCDEKAYTISGMAYVVNSSGQTSPGSSASLANRLQELKSLLDQDLISETEYNELRSKALRGD